jgi:hypothetical protein
MYKMKYIKKNRFRKNKYKTRKYIWKKFRKGGASMLVESESTQYNPNAVVTIGRFSGTHKGHSKLIKNVNKFAKKQKALPFIFVTGYGKNKTTNRDPLLHQQKIDFLRRLNPKYQDSIIKAENYPESYPIKTIFDAINFLYTEKGISNITIILGEDRKIFADRIKNYFDQKKDIKITIGPLEERSNIKQKGEEFEVSGTNVRKFSREGETKSLKSLLPSKTSMKLIKELTQAIIDGTPSPKKTKKKKRDSQSLKKKKEL